MSHQKQFECLVRAFFIFCFFQREAADAPALSLRQLFLSHCIALALQHGGVVCMQLRATQGSEADVVDVSRCGT